MPNYPEQAPSVRPAYAYVMASTLHQIVNYIPLCIQHRQTPVFEDNYNVAFQDAVVENQIDEIVLVADQYAFLPRFETEAMTEFEQEIRQLVEQAVFERGFAHDFLWLEAEKLEDIRVANGKRGPYLGRDMGLAGEFVLVRG